MDGASTQLGTVTPHDKRSRVSLVWLLVFVLGIWLSALIPTGHKAQPDRPGSRLETRPSPNSGLEALAELRGDHRSLHQIQRGNELIDAVAEGDEDKVKKALGAGADVNARSVDICRYGYTALMEASLVGHEGLVGLLLAAGADVNLDRDGETALHFAVRTGYQPIIKRLVAAGAQHDPKQLRLSDQLIWASCKGFVMRDGEGFPLFPGVVDDPDSAPAIQDVLKEGADVNAADPRGFTPLMYAANLGLLDNVKTLVVNGADLRRAAKDGSTALSLAERSDSSVNREERLQVVEYLRKVLVDR